MKTPVAFAPLATVGGSAVLLQEPVALYIALGLVGFTLVIEVALFVLYVCRPGDRKDLLKWHHAWRGR